MIDDADRAGVVIQAEHDARERALMDRLSAAHAPRDPSVDRFCIDCEGEIEPERWKALRGATSRCAACAHDYERRERAAR